tara:strand:- start:18057 stop:18707 length:651 start_codon:yes stop_codon:yes gene_type:complete
MTHLEILNNVLRRLREDEAEAISSTDYTRMISDFVNDSMDMVQAVHNWHSLFTQIDVTTIASTQGYTLDGLGQMGQVYYAYNDTTNSPMNMTTLRQMMLQTDMGSGSSEGSPIRYAYNSVAADDDPNVLFWPIPDDVYTITFHVKQHQAAITDGATEVLVPEQPVIQLALAMAKEERGEDGSGGSGIAMGKAKAVLADYVALDRERHPELGIWEVE